MTIDSCGSRMVKTGNNLIGIGIYSVPEAAWLTGVRARRIRRWLRGYGYAYRGQKRRSPPVWMAQFADDEEALALGFLDLMEIRVVDALRQRGVSWGTIRRAAERAREMFGTAHPFCTNEFLTDGRKIFVEVLDGKNEGGLLELSESQRMFKDFLWPYLSGVQFEAKVPARWWPLGRDRQVVIDPARSLGKPIVSQEGVPTRVLAEAWAVEKSVPRVAAWYEVAEQAVRDAIEFEQTRAA